MLVPAPGLFSITTCWPQILDSQSAVMRATVSVDPPGAYGTTTRTGRVGQAWANVGKLTAGASANVAARATRRRRSMMIAVFNRHSPDEQSLRRSVDLVNSSSFLALRKARTRHAKISPAAAKSILTGSTPFTLPPSPSRNSASVRPCCRVTVATPVIVAPLNVPSATLTRTIHILGFHVLPGALREPPGILLLSGTHSVCLSFARGSK